MKFWIEFISSLCLKSFFPFRRHRRLWWARPGRQQWYPHSQYTPKNAGIINGNGWVSHPSAPSSNERHTLWLMDCPLLAKMCETDTPVHVLSFFFCCPATILSEHNGDTQTDLVIMHLQEMQHMFWQALAFLSGVVYMSKVLGSKPRAFPSSPAEMGQETNTKHLLSSCTDNSV